MHMWGEEYEPRCAWLTGSRGNVRPRNRLTNLGLNPSSATYCLWNLGHILRVSVSSSVKWGSDT